MADYLTKAFCVLALIFGQPASNVFANINFNEYRESRESALSQIKSGKTKLGLIGLVKLSEKGDGVSSHTLGLFYLKAHQVVRPDVDKAVRLFTLGASQCYAPSLRVLRKNFYGNKTSKYFDLTKIDSAEAACKKKQDLEAEKRKEAEEQKRAEIKRKEAEAEKQRRAKIEKEKEEQRRKAEAESKRALEGGDENLISANIVFAWANILPKFSEPIGGGSGFAISENGYFLTNHHVAMSEECNHLAVSYNKLQGVGKIVAYNESLDLALLKVDAPTPYFAKFDNTKLRVGERLVAIGYPLGSIFGLTPTITEGTLVNASDRKTALRKDGFLMVSVPITQGNSGGPVFSRNNGIRGIVSYHYKTDDVVEYLKEKGQNVNLDGVNLNFMVSGIRAFNWINENARFASPQKVSTANSRYDTEDVATLGLKALASITCYKE